MIKLSLKINHVFGLLFHFSFLNVGYVEKKRIEKNEKFFLIK